MVFSISLPIGSGLVRFKSVNSGEFGKNFEAQKLEGDKSGAE